MLVFTQYNPMDGDIAEMEMLSLSKYFDVIPQSAMIFTIENQTLLADPPKVCYVNQAFLNNIGESPLSEAELFEMGLQEPRTRLVPDDFMSMLEVQCINPSAAQFLQWIKGVVQKPNKINNLKTRFKGFTLPQDSYLSDRTTQFVDIEWNAVVMEKKFIILTGRRTGTVQFSTVTPHTEPSVQSNMRHMSIDEVEEPEEFVPLLVRTATSPSSSSSGNMRHPNSTRFSSSTTPSKTSRSFSDGDEATDYECDKWQHTEKVHASGYGNLITVYQSYGRRKYYRQTSTRKRLEVNGIGAD
jgi:hypothetical protein